MEDHQLTITDTSNDFQAGKFRWQGVCSCGWSGSFKDEEEVKQAHGYHLQRVAQITNKWR